MVTFCGLRKGYKFIFQHNTEGPVFIAGSFNKWNTSATPMGKVAPGRWEVILDLPPGEHQFRYYAAGRWFTDYAADGIERNPMGSYNSIIVVGRQTDAAADTTDAADATVPEKEPPAGRKYRRPRGSAAPAAATAYVLQSD